MTVAPACFVLITRDFLLSSSLESLDESLEELDLIIFVETELVLGFSAVFSFSDSELDEESLELSAVTAAPLVFPDFLT